WRIIFGDHLFIQKIELSKGKGIIDFRQTLDPRKEPSFLEMQAASLQQLLQKKITKLPESIIAQDLSLLCITEKERYNIEHFSCFLPKKGSGNIAYESVLCEVGTMKCQLAKAHCDATWDGKTLTIKDLLLAKDIHLHHLQLTVHPDRLELGFVTTIFNGLLRADGCLRKKDSSPLLEGALFGEQLSMERLSKFLGLKKKISGNLREGRLVFRGSPLHPIDSEASLRILVDHFRFKKKEWASLSIASNLIGRKISVTDFQLKQQENRLNAVGEMSLPEDWFKIGEAPFHCKLKATITDASQLLDLLGTTSNDINGKIFIDGDIIGGANRAEGYLHLQGADMSFYGLPINVIDSTLLFHGETTILSNLDLWNGNSHLQLSGSIGNSWPYYYEAEGTIKCWNFFEKWKHFEKWIDSESDSTAFWNERIQKGLYTYLSSLKNIQGGVFQAQWKGKGTPQKQEGSFDMGVQEATLRNQPFEFHTIGSYAPEVVNCPTLKIHSGKKLLSTSLSFSPSTIDFTELAFQENGESTLSGSITLPINGIRLLGGDPFSSIFEWNKPMEINLALHHFSSDLLTEAADLPIENFFLNGSIRSSGLWKEPSAAISLSGTRTNTSSDTPFHLELTSKNGEGSINASLGCKNGNVAQLHGTLPMGLIHLEEGTPLKNPDAWPLAPLGGSCHLGISLPESSIDFLTSHFFPNQINVLHGTVEGELELQGTLAAPELAGHLSVKAEECTLGSILPPLQGLKASISLSKEKFTLENGSAFLGKGKLEAFGFSTGNLRDLHHEYHFQGGDLLLFQKEDTAIKGRAALLLQGGAQGGKLTGSLTITELTRILHPDLLRKPGSQLDTALISKSSSGSVYTPSRRQTSSLALPHQPSPPPRHDQNEICGLNWKPQLTLTPFFLPPGIIVKSISPPLPNSTSWKSDVILECDTKNHIHASPADKRNFPINSCIKKIDLHLNGPLSCPSPEGSLELSEFSILSPQGPMHFLEGGIHFSSNQPWKPLLQLTAKIKLGFYKMMMHLDETLEEPLLSFETTPFLSQETAALLLGKPTKDFSTEKRCEGWIAELPFWIRQQEVEEPTTINKQPSFNDAEESSNNLGFGGLGIFDQADLK
ncbi:MAG: hypothetical protein K9M81_01555, partial [Chthoniobacterales bacterium]|nr:hypothetical protein [Chthoniobacterales bacterium]